MPLGFIFYTWPLLTGNGLILPGKLFSHMLLQLQRNLPKIDDLRKREALLQEKETSEIDDYREPLSCDERREITLLISWGGPSDGYKVYFDKDGEAIEGYYFFADRFEYEEFKLTGEELASVLAVYFS